ncbi:nucleotidyltransferase family protein [Bacillus niameyensis]|uniref:nucleotidyltransferase family protein n=1 Tax=Bacillus niameyensis TaxID=1522308 RepID=UPI000785FD0B|nr:nucleotidyltransferase family protein [Bacillus niameyensis]
MLETTEDINQLIMEDDWMMNILKTAQKLNLPDWWICAGFIRSKIWDQLHGFQVRTPLADIDVIYFDPNNPEKHKEREFEKKLIDMAPSIPWSVKNQARMHLLSGFSPYSSSVEGIAKFPETVTALGAKLDEEGNVVFVAPWGIEDVLQMEVRPTSYYATEKKGVYEKRIASKNWQAKWPKLKIFNADGILLNV